MKLFYKEKIGNKRIIHILGLKFKYKKKSSMEDIIEIKIQNYINVFLNSFYDPQDIKPKSGKLKYLNEGNTELIRIVHDICSKYNLRYWLAYGTLLGAIRHKGPIPWDYDADMQMPREDFNKLFDVIEDELNGTEIKVLGVSESLHYVYGGIVLLNKTGERFLNLDITPVDIIDVSINDIASGSSDIIEKCKNSFPEIFPICKRITLKSEMKEYHKNAENFIKNLNSKSENLSKIVARLIPYNGDFTEYYAYEDVFPLRKVTYDKYNFFVPNNFKRVLQVAYGKDYMAFPQRFLVYALKCWSENVPSNVIEIINNIKCIKIN